MSVASVFIDEVEVTNFAVEGSSTRRLSRPCEAQVKLPMQHAIGGAGSLLKIYFDGVLHHHGRVLLCETTADENTGYTVYNSTDPLEIWKWRPVRDPGALSPPDGDFSFPTIIEDYMTGPQIIEAAMDASENPAGIPTDAEGPLRLARGTFAVGGVDLTGAPVDWPITMAELATLLVSTGEVDIVVTPIELDIDGNYGQIDVYNGDYGYDLTTSVIFQYGLGLHNIRALRCNEDMTNMVNKLWYYLGPKLDAQHWRANITRDDPALADPPETQIYTLTEDSRSLYDVRMEVRIYDARGDEATVGRELYRRLWQIESWLRAQPQTLMHITPIRDTAIGAFDVGDLVLVEVHPDVPCAFSLLGSSDLGSAWVGSDSSDGISGVQRVYQYTIAWDQDSVPAISELQTSPDNEGF